MAVNTASTMAVEPVVEETVRAIVGERLTLAAFAPLSGQLAGYPYVKLVVDRSGPQIHFINNNSYLFHADYIADNLLGISRVKLETEIDAYNHSFYRQENRRFLLGILALHRHADRRFFSLETVEVDTMNAATIEYFYGFVREHLDPSVPILFKPANHHQEKSLADLDPVQVPRIYAHEIFSKAEFSALNPGMAIGRLRAFRSQKDYRDNRASIEWFDILAMDKVPDDIPRVLGIINSQHTTPLSHTNVLASGWQIPNSIQLGVLEDIFARNLDQQWVRYAVRSDASKAELELAERPESTFQQPTWSLQRIKIEEPEISNTPILSLDRLRMSDHYKFGTKAANLGEMHYLLREGSERIVGFYRVKRPPRANLMPYLGTFLNTPPDTGEITRAANEFLKRTIEIPRGIALPFSIQQQFLESSPRIQQAIGKLKMALELNARQVDSLCIGLQQLIRTTRIPDPIRGYIDSQIAHELNGVSSFVVRSSSNAEDLETFSAAGIYESVNHVITADKIFDSIKVVWASLLSPRSVRLRQEMGISLDESYMGVILQEEVKSEMGGVLVTMNPMNRGDFRNVYFNISPRSVNQVVEGAELPYQCLYNTVEGGGRTLSLGNAQADLSDAKKNVLSQLAYAGRLLQSHFSPDYTFSSPVDIEWLTNEEGQVYILQLRPFAK